MTSKDIRLQITEEQANSIRDYLYAVDAELRFPIRVGDHLALALLSASEGKTAWTTAKRITYLVEEWNELHNDTVRLNSNGH